MLNFWGDTLYVLPTIQYILISVKINILHEEKLTRRGSCVNCHARAGLSHIKYILNIRMFMVQSVLYQKHNDLIFARYNVRCPLHRIYSNFY